MAKDTDPKSSQAALIAWLTEGLGSGRFRAVPVEDEEGRILSVSVILDSAGQLAMLPDPRRQQPDGGRRQMPDRSRKTRPL